MANIRQIAIEGTTYDLKMETMSGATAEAAGASGSVPAPAAGDQLKYLRGDGTWQLVSGPGSMNALTVSVNGTPVRVFDGSEAKTVNILSGNNVTVSVDEDGNISISGAYSDATSSASGLMSAEDKATLDRLDALVEGISYSSSDEEISVPSEVGSYADETIVLSA